MSEDHDDEVQTSPYYPVRLSLNTEDGEPRYVIGYDVFIQGAKTATHVHPDSPLYRRARPDDRQSSLWKFAIPLSRFAAGDSPFQTVPLVPITTADRVAAEFQALVGSVPQMLEDRRG